jgi:hypothetical protein
MAHRALYQAPDLSVALAKDNRHVPPWFKHADQTASVVAPSEARRVV